MSKEQYEAMLVAFPVPWSERNFTDPRRGGIVQIIAANGIEVPLFTMTGFLRVITARLAGRMAEVGPAAPVPPVSGASA